MTIDNNWVLVFSSNKLYQAELIQMMLEDEDIESVIINKKDSSYLIGEIELYVKASDEIKAMKIINDNDE